MRLLPLAPAALLLAACHRPPHADEHLAPPPPSASATTEPAPPAPLIDLFYRTKARVAVSSNVKNPKDYPEHLIDRRPETAWNGKTGDLDARVLFRVPSSARVRRLLITAGYDRVTKEGDLFLMNHRLAQVALTREGRLVGTFRLDPEDRRPQPLELDEPGGTFELRVTETVPGTKTAWREIVISELVVLGTAPDEELLAPAMPQVTIGSLDRPAREADPLAAVRAAAPFPSIAAFCAKHLEAERKLLARLAAGHPSEHVEEVKPHCQAGERLRAKRGALTAPFEELWTVRAREGEDSAERLVIKTERGWFPTTITFAIESPGPGCGMFSGYAIDSAAVQTPRPGAPILVLQVTKSASYLMANPYSFEAAAELFLACHLDAAGAPVCEEEIVASFDRDAEDAINSFGRKNPGIYPARWDWKREASVDDEGHIRLAPCVGPKGPVVSCSRRNAELLRRF